MSAGVCVLALIAAAPAGAALAAPTPVASKPAVVVIWKGTGWAGMKARPADFYFGQGAAPYITGMHWRTWSGTGAYGTGRLHIEQVLCSPTAAPGCTKASVRWVSVGLSKVRTHSGKRYFAAMTVKFYSKGRELTRRLAVKGGYWTGPSVWPNL